MQSSRTSVSAFPRGHEFPSAQFTLSRERVDAYVQAVGDETDYGDAAPPLAAVALGLLALQDHVSLPPGSLHTGQEVEHFDVIRAGEPLSMRSRIAQRSERQGMVISVIEFEIVHGDDIAIRARTTIMAPGGGA